MWVSWSVNAHAGADTQTTSQARFFVIKSFTEDDVHKSLKHDIWASTTFGNQRLDRAFQESQGRGPVYLFFSVNGRLVLTIVLAAAPHIKVSPIPAAATSAALPK